MSKLIETEFEDGILHVTLMRPEKRNALSDALIAEIGATFTSWSTRNDVSLAVLTGAGDKAFASGGDLKDLESLRSKTDALAFAARTRAALDAIRRFPVPVVAIVNGDALGGGAELSMACDHRIALAHARIGFLQAKLNIAPAWGGGTDLFTLVGPSRAMRLLATAEILNAANAQRAGLVDVVAPVGNAAAEFLATYIARMTQRPQVMRAIKSLAIMHRFGGSPKERASREGARLAEAWIHDDHWAVVAKMANGKKRQEA